MTLNDTDQRPARPSGGDYVRSLRRYLSTLRDYCTRPLYKFQSPRLDCEEMAVRSSSMSLSTKYPVCQYFRTVETFLIRSCSGYLDRLIQIEALRAGSTRSWTRYLMNRLVWSLSCSFVRLSFPSIFRPFLEPQRCLSTYKQGTPSYFCIFRQVGRMSPIVLAVSLPKLVHLPAIRR